jgi:large subunit ribosomal protein L18
LINDEKGETITSASINKQESAEQLGELIAKKAVEKGIKKAVFDRGWYKYHGRIKAVAEGARKGGLQL